MAARFDVGIASVVRWLQNPDPKVHGYRCRKIDMDALARDIEQYPDAYQSERAARFGVHQNAICHALKKLKVSYKKNITPSPGMRRHTAHLPDDYWTS